MGKKVELTGEKGKKTIRHCCWRAPKNRKDSRFHYGYSLERGGRFFTKCGLSYLRTEGIRGKATDYERSCFCDECYSLGKHHAFESEEKKRHAERWTEMKDRLRHAITEAYKMGLTPYGIEVESHNIWLKNNFLYPKNWKAQAK